jgi:hypothetical protein
MEIPRTSLLKLAIAAVTLTGFGAACYSAPPVPVPVKGNPYIQKLPKGVIQVVSASVPPENLAPGAEFAHTSAALRAIIKNGQPSFAYREVTYVSPGRTRDYPGLSRAFLEQQAALGGLRVILPPKKKGGIQYFIPSETIRRFLTDVDTALTSPLP